MITQQEIDVLVSQLNKAPMDQAQMYAVSAIMRKLQDAAKNGQSPETLTPRPNSDRQEVDPDD